MMIVTLAGTVLEVLKSPWVTVCLSKNAREIVSA